MNRNRKGCVVGTSLHGAKSKGGKSPLKHKIWGEGGTTFHGETIDDHYHTQDGKKHKS